MHGYNVQVGEWVGRDQFVPRYVVIQTPSLFLIPYPSFWSGW